MMTNFSFYVTYGETEADKEDLVRRYGVGVT